MTAVAAQYPHVHLKVCPDMGVAVGKMQMMFHLRCHTRVLYEPLQG